MEDVVNNFSSNDDKDYVEENIIYYFILFVSLIMFKLIISKYVSPFY